MTTTIKSVEGIPVPVKTVSPVPKEKVFDVMEIINQTRIQLPVSVGDVIIENIFGTDIVATGNVGGVKNA